MRRGQVDISFFRNRCDDDDISAVKAADDSSKGLVASGETGVLISDLSIIAEDPDGSVFEINSFMRLQVHPCRLNQLGNSLERSFSIFDYSIHPQALSGLEEVVFETA